MNHINYFSDIGLNINTTPDGNLKIQGLSVLENGLKNQVLQYAKQNKYEIMLQLELNYLWDKAWNLADWIDDADSKIDWRERTKYVPEVLKMSARIGELELLINQEESNGK